VDRVVVMGCAGSGKSTLARELAARTALPLTERDALGTMGSREYLEALAELAARPRWILDGAPYYADELIYRAADTVVFLDYPKPLVVWRALRRTVRIELTRRPAGAHEPGGSAIWRDPQHPLRWAWTSHQARRQEGRTLRTRPDLPNIEFLHLTRPSQATRWLHRLHR